MNLKGRQGVSDLNYLFKPHPSRICIDIKLEKCNIHEYFHGIIWMFTGWKVPQIFHYLKYISNFPNRLRLHSQKCKVLKTKCLSLVFPFLNNSHQVVDICTSFLSQEETVYHPAIEMRIA